MSDQSATDQNMESTDIDIYIEWPEQYGMRELSAGEHLEKLKGESQKAINLAMGVLRMMATKVSHTIQNIDQETCPDEVEVEFSLKLELEGGAVVPMVAKTTAGGQFNFKFKWNIEKPNQLTGIVKPN
jgi:hypothetical protein